MLRLNIQLFADDPAPTAEEIKAENERIALEIATKQNAKLKEELASMDKVNAKDETIETSKGTEINSLKKLEDDALALLDKK